MIKHRFFILLCCALVVACGGEQKPSDTSKFQEPSPASEPENNTKRPLTENEISGKTLFEANCSACHSIEKKLIGPALKGITEKREEQWLKNFIRNSQQMVKEGDPQAVALYKEYNQLLMNSFEFFTEQEIENILAYIHHESQ